jgi:hypothetical protein
MASWVIVLAVRRLLIAVVILLGLLAIADRIAVVVADRAVAQQIRSELDLAADPSVHISGFPFLTQALRGRYRNVHVQIPDVTSGPLRNIDVDARLLDVRATVSDMLGGRLNQVPVSRVTGSVQVHYDDLARASGIPGLAIRPASGGLQVSGQIQVLGRQVSASAVAHVSVDNEALVVTADHAQIDGTEIPSAVVTAAARALSFRVSPRQLPLGLRITGVTTGPDALSVNAEAQNVVLRRGLVPAG